MQVEKSETSAVVCRASVNMFCWGIYNNSQISIFHTIILTALD